MEAIVQYVAEIGFPIILSLYLLMRLEGKMEELTKSINELAASLK